MFQSYRWKWFIPDCYKDKKMSEKAVDNFSRALGYVSNCYKTQKCVMTVWYLSFCNTIFL